jgi:transcriptional regulator with XRE-family HTH domain
MKLPLTEFGYLCRSLRTASHRRILDQGKALGVSPSMICDIEAGRRKPDKNYIVAFANWLNADLTTTQLLLAKGSKPIARSTIPGLSPAENRFLFRTLRDLHKASPGLIRGLRGFIRNARPTA